MIKEQAELLERDFKEIIKDHNMKNGFAYFVDKADMAAMIFDKIDDNEMMHVIANLIDRIAKKHGMTVDDVFHSLKEGMNSTNN